MEAVALDRVGGITVTAVAAYAEEMATLGRSLPDPVAATDTLAAA